MPSSIQSCRERKAEPAPAEKPAIPPSKSGSRVSGDKPLWIVTGLSGAGKSTALRVFEDMNYFAVDGLPASLAPEAAALAGREPMAHYEGIAIGMDMRQENFLEEFNNSIRELSASASPRVMFLDADDMSLIRRYAQTRRPHPLERKKIGLEAAIAAERRMLRPVRDLADCVINSTGYSIHDLRRDIQKRVLNQGDCGHWLRVNLVSFGFKFGAPHDADFIFDLRFLANPYFMEELRDKSGQDKEVRDFIFSLPAANRFMEKSLDLLLFTLHELEAEGRYRTTIGLGCTGGRHRSVAIADALANSLRQAGFAVTVEHRHLDREGEAA